MDDKRVSEALSATYNKLLDFYGPQHWWPAEEPFEVIIGAILTQSTAWTNVEKAIGNLKGAGRLSPEEIRQVSQPELASIIRPSGYYNVKARKLKALTQWLKDNYEDSLEKLFANETWNLRKQLLSVYGIGEETADSIILYAGNKPSFVIDAYTRRVIDRMGIAPEKKTYAAYQKLFTDHLPEDVKMFNEYHALFVRLAKETCKRKPICQNCCLNTSATGHSTTKYACSLK